MKINNQQKWKLIYQDDLIGEQSAEVQVEEAGSSRYNFLIPKFNGFTTMNLKQKDKTLQGKYHYTILDPDSNKLIKVSGKITFKEESKNELVGYPEESCNLEEWRLRYTPSETKI
jgi:hypothetical protein